MANPSKQQAGSLIAVVDDDHSVRRALSRLLRSNSYACVTYESGEEALADPLVKESDFLILDMQLGGMNGFDVRDRLRTQGVWVPHVFTTAHTHEQSPDWFGRVGDSPILTKPFEERDLIGLIERSLWVKAK
jgi:FixJ family two-component response regulator